MNVLSNGARSATCTALILIAAIGSALAQVELDVPGGGDKSDELVRTVGPELARWHRTGEVDGRRGRVGKSDSSRALVPNDQFVHVGNEVLIEAVAETGNRSLRAELEAVGLRRSVRTGRLISGVIPIERIDRAAETRGLRFIRPVRRPHRAVGRVTSRGDSAVRAGTARGRFGVDGTGVQIGVVSDSYGNLSSVGTDVGFGDIPHDVRVLFDNPVEALGASTDEGRAMMQIIQDLAPEAQLSFYTANFGRSGMARGIRALAEEGAEVIVDDIFYLTSPFFQDGVVSRAVDRVVEEGVSYFSAAGNQGTDGYAAPFRSSGQLLQSQLGFHMAHDFEPGPGVDIRQEFRLPPGGSFRVTFQWDQPFALGGSFGSQSDYDIFILDSEDRVVTAGTVNNFGADPVEIVSVSNTSDSDAFFSVVIGKYLGSTSSTAGTGPDAGRLQYVDVAGQATAVDRPLEAPTIIGQANSEGAEAVGAAFYQFTPSYGVDPPRVESFSSLGGVPVLFDRDGDRLSEPIVRDKPEIVAPDGVNTTFFGTDLPPEFDADLFPNFFGTSAAAPHAAAVAALILQAAGGPGSLSPARLYERLERTAIDMDDPASTGFDAGFDARTGYGLIQADAAVSGSYNHVPIAVSDTVSVARDGVTRVHPLANDSDEDGDTLQVASVSNGHFGTASVAADGRTVLYTGSGYLPRSDTLRYVVTDGFRRTSARMVLDPLPERVVLEPNYPNPFSLSTRIVYHLPAAGHVEVRVYDAEGRPLRTLVDRIQEAGRHVATWRPRTPASGLYLYRVSLSGREPRGGKMLLLD